MKTLFRFISMVVMALTLSFAATSCGDDGDDITDATSSESSMKDLGNGIYLINGHRFVDLGLPSGLLWAETNIGAENPADDGNYYAWGETEPKSTYYWSTYKYGKHSIPYNIITKYNSSDGKTILAKEDDAAYVNWGSSCRMPTKTEFAELGNTNICTWTWTSMTTSSGSSINGYKVTSVKNGNSIFLPASGYRFDDVSFHNSFGQYWSSTLSSISSDEAYELGFFSIRYYRDDSSRISGHTVRPVAEP